MALRMEPGYAYKRVRGEWDTVVISSDVTDRARHVGYREIDGHRMAVFVLGRSTYAQLPQNLRRTPGADDAGNPLSGGAKAAIALGVGVAALAGGIGIAVAMSKPKAAATTSSSSTPLPPIYKQAPGYGGGLHPGGGGGGGGGSGPPQTFALTAGSPPPTAHAIAGGALRLTVQGPITGVILDPAIQSSEVTGNTVDVVLSGRKGQVAAMWAIPGSMSGTAVVNVT